MFKAITIACLSVFAIFSVRAVKFGLSTQDCSVLCGVALIAVLSEAISKHFEWQKEQKLTMDKNVLSEMEKKIKETNDKISAVSVGQAFRR